MSSENIESKIQASLDEQYKLQNEIVGKAFDLFEAGWDSKPHQPSCTVTSMRLTTGPAIYCGFGNYNNAPEDSQNLFLFPMFIWKRLYI